MKPIEERAAPLPEDEANARELTPEARRALEEAEARRARSAAVTGRTLPATATGRRAASRQTSEHRPIAGAHSIAPAVLPVADQIIDNRRVGKGRCVSEIAEVVFGNLPQDSAHNFS